MNKFKHIIFLQIIVFVFAGMDLLAQCNLNTQNDTLWICEGDNVDLIATGGCPTYMMNNDFNGGNVGPGWSSNCSPMFNNPCLASPNGSTYLWVGSASTFPRSLTTVSYAVTTSCRICFDMAYATQGAASPCEGPDLATEGVHLQYSLNGVTWTDINYWDPLGGYDPIMTSWQNYCEDIPVNGNVQFQWWQDVTSGNTYDHWGLDNVQIFCPPPQQSQWWTNASTGALVDTGFTTNVSPTVTTTYIAHVDDSLGSNAIDSTIVVVFPTPTLAINNLNTAYCLSANTAILTGNPVGGTFSGPGITGNIFDPATAGVGIHNIVYHLYHIANYTITGNIPMFEDDFATDMGWTGYGAGGWERSNATSGGAATSGAANPTSDNTPTADNYIVGTYINTSYPNSMSQTYWLTSPIIDCSGMNSCFIDFYSHSGCESSSFDHITIEAYNGTTWQNIYSNGGSFSESSWTNWNYSVSAQADNNPNFRVRFGMGPTDGSVTYKGWNIDDFKVVCDGILYVSDTLCDFTTTQSTEVFQAPSSTFTLQDSVCLYSNSLITYSGNGSVAGTYTWDFAGGTVVSGSGQGPYQVYWTTSGTYNITLTVDEFGCTSVLTTVPITVLPSGHPNCCTLPTPNAGANDSICSLTYNLQGTASIGTGIWNLLSGPGTATFSTAGSPISSVTVSQYGDYVFEWFEANGSGCEIGDTVYISFHPNPSVNLTPINISCYNVCDGQITATPLGSDTPYSYIWNDPSSQITSTVTGLCSDTYNVSITNVHGCTSTSNTLITEPPELIATTTFVDVLCYGGNNGSATVNTQGGTGAVTYLWNDPAAQTTQTASNLTAGTYCVVATDANGCTVLACATISEPANQMAITLTKTDISCFGGSDGTVDLTVTGGTMPYTYVWDSGQITEDLNYVPAGTYCVIVTDANGCTISDCISISQPSQLTFTSSFTPISCYNFMDGSVSVNVSNGTPPYTYLWSNGGAGYSLNNIGAGVYSVIVSDANGCTITTSINLVQPSRVIASVNTHQWICIGQTATLTASATGGSPGYSFHWNNGQISQSINVSPTTTTQYCVYAEDSEGCISDNFCTTVNVYDPISVSIQSNTDQICPGEPVVITAQATGGNGVYYLTLNNTIINSPHIIYPTQSITYNITASDDCGSPTDNGTVSIVVLELPPNSFAPDTIQGCVPLTVNFVENSPNIGQTYLWTFGDDNSYNTSNKKNPTHIFEEPGIYDITLAVTSAEGCVNVDVVEDLIIVYALPQAKFIANPEVASVIKPIIDFENLSTGAVEYHWFFGDGDSSLAMNPYHAYPAREQSYLVELRVTSDKECKDTVYLEVRVKDEYTFYAPTGFSPDGDGINDEFFIKGHNIDASRYKLIIYNRWGEVIFETEDPNASWDGRVQGGNSICPLGTYTWLAIFKDEAGVEHAETGAVTIIR